jgi:hypothetical protein
MRSIVVVGCLVAAVCVAGCGKSSSSTQPTSDPYALMYGTWSGWVVQIDPVQGGGTPFDSVTLVIRAGTPLPEVSCMMRALNTSVPSTWRNVPFAVTGPWDGSGWQFGWTTPDPAIKATVAADSIHTMLPSRWWGGYIPYANHISESLSFTVVWADLGADSAGFATLYH